MENTELYEKLRSQEVEWIRDYMKSTGGRKVVIGPVR